MNFLPGRVACERVFKVPLLLCLLPCKTGNEVNFKYFNLRTLFLPLSLYSSQFQSEKKLVLNIWKNKMENVHAEAQ